MQDLLRRFLWILLVLILVIGVGSSLFYAGYLYGKNKAFWFVDLIRSTPKTANVTQGFMVENERLVIFGVLREINRQKGIITVEVSGKMYEIKTTKESSLIPESQSYEGTKIGNWVVVNMKLDKPFVADKIYFSDVPIAANPPQ